MVACRVRDEEAALAQLRATRLPQLDERHRRVLLGAAARALGRGGITRVARVAGVSRPPVARGRAELARPAPPDERDPALLAALAARREPASRGDPLSPRRWTGKRTRQRAATLTRQGHAVSAWPVRRLLHEADERLQAPTKTRAGASQPARAAPFRSLNAQSTAFLGQGQPVVAVDAKQPDLLGACKHGGRAGLPRGQPERVNGHDCPDPALGKARPYGRDAVGRATGWVTLGRDHDTASFAVARLRRWWAAGGQRADRGGSTGSRLRWWQVEWQHFADQTGRSVTVCHRPPGTRKWHKLEQRLVAQRSLNWRGRPRVSHAVIVNPIGATTTRPGLRVRAELDQGSYPTKIPVSDQALAAVRPTPHRFHGEWNHTIAPGTVATETSRLFPRKP